MDNGRPKNLESALFQVGSTITAHKSLEEILTLIVKESLKCLDAHRVSIFIFDPLKWAMNVQISHAADLRNQQVGLFQEKEIAVKMLEHPQPLLLKESKDLLRFFARNNPQPEINSLMNVPLCLGEKAKRVLSAVLINGSFSFDENDLQLFSIFGHYAEVAIENTYLLAQVRKANNLQKNYEEHLATFQTQLEELQKREQNSITQDIQSAFQRKNKEGVYQTDSYRDALSQTFNFPLISLKNFILNPSLQKVLGEKYTENNRIIVLADGPKEIKLALAEPTRYLIDEIRRAMPPGKEIRFYVADPGDISSCFNRFKNPFSVNRFR